MDEKPKGPAPFPTAQQMMEKNIVPVKSEFLIRKVAAKKETYEAAPSPTPAPADEAGVPAESAVAAVGGGGKQDRKKQDQSRSQSRKQMRKEVRASREAELCTNFALGRCSFGDSCKFRHDLTDFLKAKPQDLPGTCPWTAVRAHCPYGITCRYALSHLADDDLHKTLRASVSVATPEVQMTEAEQPKAEDAKPDTAAEGVVKAEEPKAEEPKAEEPKAEEPKAEAESQPPAAPPQVQRPLPLPTSIEAVMNAMDKDVQAQLWKSRYDFSKADSILKSMKLRISFKAQPRPLPGQKAAASGGSNGGGKAANGAANGPAAKRQRTEAGAVPVPASVPADPAVPASAPAQASEPPAAPAPDASEQNASASTAADAVAAPVDAAAAAASDAAVVAGLAAEQTQARESANAPAAEADAPAPSTAAAPAAAAAAAAATVVAAETVVAAKDKAAEARDAHVELPLRSEERRRVDFRGKTYLAPLTTVGNLPFRRVCKSLGVDVTCGEMAMATNLLMGQASEWALLKRHPSEDLFGVQVCGGYPDALSRVGQLVSEHVTVDFMDINMGCPIDLVCDKSAGSALLRQPRRIEEIIRATSAALGDVPLTFKTRKGYNDGEDIAHTFLHQAGKWGAAAVTLHGRTRQQRYSKLADWEYIKRCGTSCAAAGLQLIGNGDVFSYLDWNQHMEGAGGKLASLMIGRGALIKPWLFTEIKEQRHWDISASERLDLVGKFCAAGLEHWGSDSRGVETTRRFLLEWLSFTCRYVPVGLLEVLPQQMNHRPPAYRGRSELETLLASEDAQDWVRISEMFLGPPPAPITFTAKHKSNAYGASAATSELDMARG